jgi:murein DD-endopeptidase MepM/ murein hydrolase activator NlpD
MVDMSGGRKDYGTGATCVKFITNGAGEGRCVKNNAASGWNREEAAVAVFYKSDWAGAVDTFVSGEKANLTKTKNENASHVVGDPANDRMTRSLYQAGGGRITSYFDGYLSTNGRHEGIDIAKNNGDAVYALTAGRVTNIVEGSTGSGGLSTIAIYNAELDKTVIYLHTDPRDPLNEGDHVDRGDHIAFESWRGVSSSGAGHTHVEMRPGRQTNASKSVDDNTLTNPIPTEFWMNRGYNICCG